MKKTSLLIFIVCAAVTAVVGTVMFASRASAPAESTESVTETVDESVSETSPEVAVAEAPFAWPMVNAANRVTKKPFGLKIDPEHSPVPNDRFTGYHVGVDFETFEEEQEIDVAIYAICDGPLVYKSFARGYGGVIVQACELEGQAITVIYGHLRLESVSAVPGDQFERGEQVGVLGTGYSVETDGVRKHLHLGVHQGEALDIRGYVQEESETTSWLDAILYFPGA